MDDTAVSNGSAKFRWQEVIHNDAKFASNRELLRRVLELAGEKAVTEKEADRIAWAYDILSAELYRRLGSWLVTEPTVVRARPVLTTESAPLVVESDWGTATAQDVIVPLTGRRAERDQYSEKCQACLADLTQTLDVCPVCAHPVRWVNSMLAQARARSARNSSADALAKAKREQAERLSITTATVLALARATAINKRAACDFAQGEEQTLLSYEQVYGAKVVLDKLHALKAEGQRGRGLIVVLLKQLGTHDPNRGAAGHKPNPLSELF